MRRRRSRAEDNENHERWAISYADFITLMFTFFAALYSLTSVDKGKMETFSNSLREVFQVMERPISERDKEKELTMETIQESVRGVSGVTVTRDSRGIVVTFSGPVLFSSGSSDILDRLRPALTKLSGALKKTTGPIMIEGHTDDVPISGGKHSSNWDLSTGRAASVLSFFIGDGHDPKRFSLSGYGEYRPVASNEDEEGRRKNRRVEIVIRQ